LRSAEEAPSPSVAYEQPAPVPPGCVMNPDTGELQRIVLVPLIVGKIATMMAVRQKCIDSKS
jgi:hypothetical protein